MSNFTPAPGGGSSGTASALSGTITAAQVAGTAVTLADTGTVTSAMIADGAIVNADVNAGAAIAYSKLALAGSIVNADLTAATITDGKLNPATYTASIVGFNAWTGDPIGASTNQILTSGTLYIAKILIPAAATATSLSFVSNTVGSTLTTVATATVSGTQSAPASGAWTLTTSSMSGYNTTGVVTIGSQVVAYSAWSGTSMTVRAGGYTPSASYTNATTITANTNCMILFDSTGAYLGASVDQTGNWTSGTGQKLLTVVPAAPSITAGSVYVGLISTGTTPVKPQTYPTLAGLANAGPSGTLSGASLRFAVNGTGLTTGVNSAITPSSGSNTNAIPFWAAIS